MTESKHEKAPPPASAVSADEHSTPCADSADALEKVVAEIRRRAPPMDKSRLVIDGNWPSALFPGDPPAKPKT